MSRRPRKRRRRSGLEGPRLGHACRGMARVVGLARLIVRHEDLPAEAVERVLVAFLAPLPARLEPLDRQVRAEVERERRAAARKRAA